MVTVLIIDPFESIGTKRAFQINFCLCFAFQFDLVFFRPVVILISNQFKTRDNVRNYVNMAKYIRKMKKILIDWIVSD